MSISIMEQIRQDFWSEAFKNGARCGVMRDGHYDWQVDTDWVAMFCGGAV